MRYCVSLGRRALDPTMEFAGLCNADNDIMLLHLHPLHRVWYVMRVMIVGSC